MLSLLIFVNNAGGPIAALLVRKLGHTTVAAIGDNQVLQYVLRKLDAISYSLIDIL